jgi:hypothetical protein
MNSQISSAAGNVGRLQECMALAGWTIDFIDIDLTGVDHKVDIKLSRDDGLWLLARVDPLGRATVEFFQREKSLGMSPNTKGRRPLSPQVDDVFLRRQRFEGARSMLRHVTAYIADNSVGQACLGEVRSAWAAVMSAPLRLAA